MTDLAPSAEQFQLAFESARASAWVWDIRADQVTVHPGVDSWLAAPASGVKRSRQDWFQVIHPDDREKMITGIQRSLETGERFQDHYRVRNPSGGWIWIAVRAGVRRDASGVPVEMAGVAIDITAQKTAELDLLRRERAFTRLINSVDGIVWEADAGTLQFLFVSRAAERILGYPLEEWTQTPDFWVRRLHPGDAQWCVDFRRQPAQAGQQRSCEYRMIARDGRVVWLHDTATFHSEPDGTSRWCGILLDVTARREAEEARRESEANFQLLFEQSPAGLVIFNEDGERVQVNPAYCKFLQRSATEVIDTPLVEKVRPEDRERVRQGLETLRQGGTVDEELGFVRGDGETAWGHLTARRTVHGGRLGKGISIVQDITAQKRAEAILRQSQELFRTVANDTPALIWTSAADGRNSFINRSFAEFLGVEGDVLPGGSFGYLHPGDRQGSRERFESAVEQRSHAIHEARFRRFDGQYRWILIDAAPRFSAEGDYLGHVASGTDITERKLAEQELRATHDRLAVELNQRARLQRELSALSDRLIRAQEEERRRVARELHDSVGNQIAALTIALATFNRESPSPKTQWLTKMLRDLAQGVRDISHQLHPVMLEFAGLAAALREMCREYGKLTGMGIAVTAADDLGEIPAGTALCAYRVTQEALQNIAKHSGAKLASVSLTRSGGDLVLRISDGGKGFDPELAGKNGGLGLVSIRERIRLARGALKIESAPGRGTVVRISVPVEG